MYRIIERVRRGSQKKNCSAETRFKAGAAPTAGLIVCSHVRRRFAVVKQWALGTCFLSPAMCQVVLKTTR